MFELAVKVHHFLFSSESHWRIIETGDLHYKLPQAKNILCMEATNDNIAQEHHQLHEAVTGGEWSTWLAKKWRERLHICEDQVMNHEGHVMLGPKALLSFLSSLHFP